MTTKFHSCGIHADLPKLGGIGLVAHILQSESDTALVAAAAFVLGTAASNNPSVQATILADSRVMTTLLQVSWNDKFVPFQPSSK